MTRDQFVEETRHWPPEKVGELVGRLTEDLRASDPETEGAWRTEISRRLQEIQSGQVQGIHGEEVSARIRGILGRCGQEQAPRKMVFALSMPRGTIGTLHPHP